WIDEKLDKGAQALIVFVYVFAPFCSCCVCLLAIPLAGSRLRRSLNRVCSVDQALGAWSTLHTLLFARPGRASARRERAKMLRIRYPLNLIGRLINPPPQKMLTWLDILQKRI